MSRKTTEQEQDAIDRNWLALGLVAVAVGILIGSGATAAYFAANPVVETEYKTVYSTVEKPVSDDGIVFTVRTGPQPPDDWGYPVRVEFKRVVENDWETWYIAKAFEREPFVVGLNESTRYQITVTPPSGESRVLGSFIPQQSNGNVELVVEPCCADNFSASGGHDD